MPPLFFTLKEELILVIMSQHSVKNLTPSSLAGNSKLTTHPEGTVRIPSGHSGVKELGVEPCTPTFPRTWHREGGFNEPFELCKRERLGPELTRRGNLLPAPVTQRALAT